MPLQPGARLGPYEILSALGTGGMGEVYRAKDTSLGRDVAIKVLPDAFARDAERLARFEREAKTLAALNHPNIAHIYGLDRRDRPDGQEGHALSSIVMELVEGEDLSQRIARGALPIDEALSFAKQIAAALEAAHEQGIIHRDLKPANIKVRPDGAVKVLDFGLAKLVAGEAGRTGGADALSASPTMSAQATLAGTILGTAAYMSPEQARGREVDRRTDIWSFGCVFFEMLTGRRAFEAVESLSDTVAAILTKEPDWQRLPATASPDIRKLLTRCLQKDPHKRLPHIGVATLEIDEAQAAAAVAPGVHTSTPEHGRGSGALRVPTARRALPWGIAALSTLIAAAVLVSWAPWRGTATPRLQRLRIDLGVDASLVTGGGASTTLSPDGTTLAFAAQKSDGRQQLYVRRLDELQAKPLAGTEGAYEPFFSPDGTWVAFFSPGGLKKIAVTGGAVITLCAGTLGGTWADDGTIVFSPGFVGTLARVPADGGTPQAITTLTGDEQAHRWGQLLPDGKAVLYTATDTPFSAANANLIVQSLPNGPRKLLQKGATYGRYLPSGHLVYVHDATLFAAPFDPIRLETTGPAVRVLEGVTTINSGGLVGAGGSQFAVTAAGALVYVPGKSVDVYADPIAWIDRGDRPTPMRSALTDWSNLRFSPDGRQIAMDINEGGYIHAWIYDSARDALFRLTTGSSGNIGPMWTPDGRGIGFASTRGSGIFNVYWQRADGTGDVQRLTESPNVQFPTSWHPSGRFLAFNEIGPKTAGGVMMLPMEGNDAAGWKPGKPAAFLDTEFDEWNGKFSPDGRWLAYVSNESGRYEVYVRPFPGPGGKWLISTGGAAKTHLSWSSVRHELLFVSSEQQIMVASYAVSGDEFRADKPRLWSETKVLTRPRGGDFDLHPDGQRVAAAPDPLAPPAVQDRVVIVWGFFEELDRLAPVRK